MNKVITINLNGNAYQLEEGGYDALRAYLDSAGRRLDGNPDRDEIIADIEQAIADKFRSLMGASKSVVSEKEVAAVIAEMGPVEDASGQPEAARPGAGATPPPGAAAGPTPSPGAAPRRLYKIHEGAMVGGVCNGIAAYTHIDVSVIRVLFAMLMFMWGTGVLAYILLWIFLPLAENPDEMAAAHGTHSATAQEFIRRAREGYYEGMKTFGDRRAHKEWRRKFKREMRGWKRDFQWEMHSNWAQPAPGAWLSLPLINLLLAIISIVGICAIVSLCVTGSIFGFWFLSGFPLWLGILILIAIMCGLKAPLKAMRRSFYYGGYGRGGCGFFGFLWHAFMWVAVIYFILWITGTHAAGLHELGQHLPPKLHHAAHSLKDWWDQQ